MRAGAAPGMLAQIEAASNPDSTYSAEKASLEGFRIVPIAHAPQIGGDDRPAGVQKTPVQPSPQAADSTRAENPI